MADRKPTGCQPSPNDADWCAENGHWMNPKHTPELWHLVERSDTWNIHQGKRCIARLQKKTGAMLEAEEIIASHNALAGLNPEGVRELVEAASALECSEPMGPGSEVDWLGHERLRAALAKVR